MNNNIQRIRIDRGLTQPELVELVNLPFIDVPMLSRFEHGICLPTPFTLKRLARSLGVFPDELYELDEQEYTLLRKRRESLKNSESFEITELMIEIPHGAENAISKRDLMHALDCSERKLYKLIQEARQRGYLIIALGKGYYQTSEEEELRKYLQRMKRMRRSIDNVIDALNSKFEDESEEM